MDKEIKDEIFKIDFLYIKEDDTRIKNAEIIFQTGNQYIVINGEKTYFNVAYINEEGLSRDHLYHKISTPGFVFWIFPADYDRFKNILAYRQKILIENSKSRLEQIKSNIEQTFEYDQIDNDIYNCFIAYKGGMPSKACTPKKFCKIEEKIDELCKINAGKYFKTEAKKAKFAIIYSFSNRAFSSVKELRQKGYKVTTFEKALEFFGLAKMWDCEAMIKAEEDYKKFMKKHYGS
jgi:hypothetical protein